MPVNMDPSKKHRRPPLKTPPVSEQTSTSQTPTAPQSKFGEETEADREKELADAEAKNLWDATEVIDMDKF